MQRGEEHAQLLVVDFQDGGQEVGRGAEDGQDVQNYTRLEKIKGLQLRRSLIALRLDKDYLTQSGLDFNLVGVDEGYKG